MGGELLRETVLKRILKQQDSQEDESLEENTFSVNGTGIFVSDGMMDRVPFWNEKLPEEECDGLKEVIFTAANGNLEGALNQLSFTPIHNGASFIQMAEVMERYVTENREDLATEDLLFFIRRLLTESEMIEEVKLGLFLYQNLFECDAETDEIVLIYADSGEFAMQAMDLVKRMENGNQKLFELVKDSSGYELVTAVELLEPETKEIEDWIFRNGTDPFLGYYYSSVPISRKCRLIERMKDPELSKEDYSILCSVICGYFEEGYANGYETLENVNEILKAFFELCQRRITKFMLYSLSRIQGDIRGFKKHREKTIVIPEEVYCLEQCDRILNSEAVRESIIEHVNRGEWIPLGERIGVLTDEIVLDGIRKEPMRNVSWYRYLKEEDSRRRALNLYFEEDLRAEVLREDKENIDVLFYLLELCGKFGIADSVYFHAALDEDNFLISGTAANILVDMNRRGIAAEDELLFRAQNYLARMEKDELS